MVSGVPFIMTVQLTQGRRVGLHKHYREMHNIPGPLFQVVYHKALMCSGVLHSRGGGAGLADLATAEPIFSPNYPTPFTHNAYK